MGIKREDYEKMLGGRNVRRTEEPADPMNLHVPSSVITGSVPSKSNCYRMGKTKKGQPCIYKTPALIAYEKQFFIQCGLRDLGIKGYFELRIDVYYPSERADLDNSLKVVLDCLQGCRAIKNDRQCVFILARKFKDADKPRIEFTLTPV